MILGPATNAQAWELIVPIPNDCGAMPFSNQYLSTNGALILSILDDMDDLRYIGLKSEATFDEVVKVLKLPEIITATPAIDVLAKLRDITSRIRNMAPET